MTRPYSHSLSDDQRKYRGADELADEAAHDPIVVLERQLVARGASDRRSRSTQMRAEANGVGARRGRGRARRAATGAGHRARSRRRAPAGHRRCRASPQADADASPVTFGEAIRLTLHEQMAHDERIRVFGEDVADADPHVMDEVPGKGGVFGITFGLQRAFGDARCFNTPLAEANIIGRAVGQGDARSATMPRDPVLRLRVAGDEPTEVGGGDDALALERRVHVPDGRSHRRSAAISKAARSGTASAASRSSPTSPAS